MRRGSRRGSLLVAGLLVACSGCAQSGFAALAPPESPAPPNPNMPLVASRDIGRPYTVLGYVFRTSEGHKSSMTAENEELYVVSPASEQLAELRAMAARRGADAIVGVELFPFLNGWGQPTGYSIGGWAVKLQTAPGQTVPTPAPSASQSPAPTTATSPVPFLAPEPASGTGTPAGQPAPATSGGVPATPPQTPSSSPP